MTNVYSGVDNLEVMAEAINYNYYLLNLIVVSALPRDHILDFGAGTGTFACEMVRRGYKLTCIEPDAKLKQNLQSLGLTTLAGLDELPAESVDYIYTLNVLEHIEDDASAVAGLFRVMKPNGRLLIYVPAFATLFTSMDRKVGHLRRYTRSDLKNLLKSRGFVVKRLEYVDSLGFLVTLLFKFVDPGTGKVNSTALKIYDRLGFPVSRRCDLGLRHLFGKNVLALAHRPVLSGQEQLANVRGPCGRPRIDEHDRL